MSRCGSVPASLLFLSLATLAGCGGGSESKTMDADIGGGNGQEIRAAYGALQTDGGDSGGSSASSGSGSRSGSSAPDPLTQAASDPPVLDAFSTEATTAVNLVRAEERVCGAEVLPAVAPLSWDARAAHAALLESEWMLTSDSFGHVWPGGELVWDRLTMSGYRWNKADENIAAGFRNLADAMQAWIDSPSHCVALMRSDVTDFAIAVVPGRKGGAYLSYWTMVLAAPRPVRAQ